MTTRISNLLCGVRRVPSYLLSFIYEPSYINGYEKAEDYIRYHYVPDNIPFLAKVFLKLGFIHEEYLPETLEEEQALINYIVSKYRLPPETACQLILDRQHGWEIGQRRVQATINLIEYKTGLLADPNNELLRAKLEATSANMIAADEELKALINARNVRRRKHRSLVPIEKERASNEEAA